MAGIPRRAWLAVAVYAALLVTLATPLYDSFKTGEDDRWVTAAMVAALHLGVGVAVARTWVLALPVAFTVVDFFATGGEALSWLVLILGLPILLALTGTGWAAGRLLGPRAGQVAAAVFALAALPTAAATAETIKRSRAPHVPKAMQRQ